MKPDISSPFNKDARIRVIDPDEGVEVTARFDHIDGKTGDYMVEIEEDHGLGKDVLRRVKPWEAVAYG